MCVGGIFGLQNPRSYFLGILILMGVPVSLDWAVDNTGTPLEINPLVSRFKGVLGHFLVFLPPQVDYRCDQTVFWVGFSSSELL